MTAEEVALKEVELLLSTGLGSPLNLHSHNAFAVPGVAERLARLVQLYWLYPKVRSERTRRLLKFHDVQLPNESNPNVAER